MRQPRHAAVLVRTSKLGMIICGCSVPIHPVIDGRLFVFLLAHVRIVGAPATCLLLYIYAGMDVRLRPALGWGTTLVDQMRPALRWRYRWLKFPSRQANEGNEFRDRADEKLSVVETSAGAVRTSSPQEPRSKPGFNYPNRSIWAGLGGSIVSADTAGAGASSGGGWECRSRNSFSFLKSSFNVSSRLP